MSNRGNDFEDDDFPPERPAPKRRDERWRDVRRTAQDAVNRASSRGRRRSRGGLASLSERPVVLIGAIIGGLILLSLIGYLLFSSRAPETTVPTSTPQTSQRQTPPATDQGPQSTPALPADDVFSRIFGSGDTTGEPARQEGLLRAGARILLKLALAALLAGILAFRPRKDVPVMQRNPYVAQTQILLAIVAAALMMVVADNAARAFGIFAAASLVRFRTNIRDPKEITVLLVSLAIGLASGVGRIEVAILLSLFVLLILWVLEYYEPAQVFRAMELKVNTRNVMETDEILKETFEKHGIAAELREVDREDKEDPIGKIVYYVNVNPSISTDDLSEEIFSTDPHNIDSIEWDQKKSTSYIYR
jgi:uncharacterized membrane protein YhiD involved in acid resistance